MPPMPPMPPIPPEAVDWLRQHALPFATAEPGRDLADLRPFASWIGAARVVALGEATHGTREFFQLKHRLAELLVGELGFTVFAIEASMPDTEPLNRYVLSGEGDPARLIRGMGFWTWDTREVLALVEWLRELNRSGRGRVQFRGFDLQNPGSAAAVVIDLAARAAPERTAGIRQAYAWAGGGGDDAMPPERALGRLSAASGVLAGLEADRSRLLEHAAAAEVEWALQNARIVIQQLVRKAGLGSRERGMAENVEWLLAREPPGARIVLWAHNAHVRKSGKVMGALLAQRFGADFFSCGLTFGRGSYRALGEEKLAVHETPAPRSGSLESYLASAGLPRFFVDLRNLPAGGPAGSWLAEPRPARQVGARELAPGYIRTTAAASYDALAFLDEAGPSVGLP
jgi:erythromycin esterase